MRPSSETSIAERRAGIPGYRIVLALGAAGVAIAGVLILIAFLVVSNRGEAEGACQQEPRVCAAVHDYLAALNARDAERLRSVLTEQGLRRHLRVSSAEDLLGRLDEFSAADRIRDLRITSVGFAGDEAVVSVRFIWRHQEEEAVYRLVRTGGRWLIDG